MNKKKGSLTEGVGRLKTGESTKFKIIDWKNQNLGVVGLSKLQSTTEEVKVLQEQLKEMKPALQIAAKDADEMIKIIAADTVSVFSIHFS